MEALSMLVFLSSGMAPLFENSTCSSGVCKKLKDCPSAILNLTAGVHPVHCGFQQAMPIVCCQRLETRPPQGPGQQEKPLNRLEVTKLAPGEKSRRMCLNYSSAVYSLESGVEPLPGSEDVIKGDECRITPEKLIVGGEDAAPKEFPHMALIGFGPEENVNWLCGGTLISEQHVLTAAHCTYPNRRRGRAKWVRLGELDLNSDLDLAQPLTVAVSWALNHPRYRSPLRGYDIAILGLKSRVAFSGWVRPACLPPPSEPDPSRLVASGWGASLFQGPGSPVLRKVTLGSVGARECARVYGGGPPFDIPGAVLCAGGLRKDTCQGDSGGPLQVVLKEPYCMYQVIGITSYGKSCGMYPGVYTRVAHYVDWIEGVVWPHL